MDSALTHTFPLQFLWTIRICWENLWWISTTWKLRFWKWVADDCVYIYIYDYILNEAILTLAGCFRKQAGIIFLKFLDSRLLFRQTVEISWVPTVGWIFSTSNPGLRDGHRCGTVTLGFRIWLPQRVALHRGTGTESFNLLCRDERGELRILGQD